jgi:hypothetical protein
LQLLQSLCHLHHTGTRHARHAQLIIVVVRCATIVITVIRMGAPLASRAKCAAKRRALCPGHTPTECTSTITTAAMLLLRLLLLRLALRVGCITI